MAASINPILAQVQRWTASAQTAELSDAVLLGRYAHQRDEAAFAALVARNGVLVWRVCRRILGNVQEAEDAFQAVFLILARKAASLKQPEALPGWLHGVALLAVGGQSGTVQLWEIDTGKERFTLKKHSGSCFVSGIWLMRRNC